MGHSVGKLDLNILGQAEIKSYFVEMFVFFWNARRHYYYGKFDHSAVGELSFYGYSEM